MSSYIELKQKAEKMLAEAEQVRQKEIDEVIAEIKSRLDSYGLTVQDLGGGAGRKRGSGAGKAKSASPAKYRGPNGQTWSGGRGRKPQWVVDALKAGRKIEEFAI